MIRKKQKNKFLREGVRKWKKGNKGNKRFKKMKGLRGKEWEWERKEGREGGVERKREISTFSLLIIWY